MGSLCSKSSRDPSDPFAHPGRTVGDVPEPSSNPRAVVPKISAGGGGTGRMLGGGGGGGGGQEDDARRAAARAAEERAAKASQQAQKGKLGRDLAREKAQTVNGALGSASRDERRRRDADEGAEARTWN